MTCPEVPKVTNGAYDAIGYDIRDTATIKCHYGFKPVDNSLIVCELQTTIGEPRWTAPSTCIGQYYCSNRF